jgi:hypothetical protein
VDAAIDTLDTHFTAEIARLTDAIRQNPSATWKPVRRGVLVGGYFETFHILIEGITGNPPGVLEFFLVPAYGLPPWLHSVILQHH